MLIKSVKNKYNQYRRLNQHCFNMSCLMGECVELSDNIIHEAGMNLIYLSQHPMSLIFIHLKRWKFHLEMGIQQHLMLLDSHLKVKKNILIL